MSLDLSPLQNALQRLQEGWIRYLQDTTDIQIRDGLIQRFEFTYELSHKMLKRHLMLKAASSDDYETADFQFIIRSASEQGLLKGDWLQWRTYREMRSKTSHSYAEEIAIEVVERIPAFLDEATFLLDKLLQRNIP
jgi:nucleotidyltransferase substrate binding protein (TIGR01987 family)